MNVPPGHDRSPNPLLRDGRASLALAASLVANAALGGWIVYTATNPPAPKSSTATGDATAAATVGTIEALGRVQPAGGVISVFGPPGDQILDLKVALGATVRKGDRLALLSGDEQRKLSVSALEAQIQEAEKLRAAIALSAKAKAADLDLEAANAKRAAEADVAAAKVRIEGLDKQLAQARVEQNRLATIAAGGAAVSPQEREQVDLLVTKAELELSAAKGLLAKAQDQLASAPQLTDAKKKALQTEAERGAAQVPYESLKAAKLAAEQKVRDADLVAPVDGRVVRVSARTGDTLTNQPILQLADTDAMTVRAEVYENAVPTLRQWLATAKNGEIQVEVDPRVLGGGATAAPLKGTLMAPGLAPIIAQNTVFALGPREDSDRRVLEADVALDAASSKALANLIGLQVRVRFLPPK